MRLIRNRFFSAVPPHRVVFLFAVLLPLALVGCVGGPSPQTLEGSSLQQLLDRHRQEQSLRRSRLKRWQVKGFFDLESENGGRRHRVEVQGEGDRRARVRVFGPFQQIAMSLWLGKDKIHFLAATQKEVITVPSTARGLAYLTGIWMEPKRLLEILTGMTAGDVVRGKSSGDLTTAGGERLLLEDGSGLLKERSHQSVSGYSWQVVYAWPTTSKNVSSKSTFPIMPSRVDITLKPGSGRVGGEDAGVSLKYRLKKWQFFRKSFADGWFMVGRLPPGFRVVHMDKTGKPL